VAKAARRVSNVLYRPAGHGLLAAVTDRAASPHLDWPGGVLSLRAALANVALPVDPRADIADLTSVEPFRAKTGQDS